MTVDAAGRRGSTAETLAANRDRIAGELRRRRQRTEQGTTIDCRSEEGIVIGLLDAMIVNARIVADFLRANTATHAIGEAVKDLRADEDVAHILRAELSS